MYNTLIKKVCIECGKTVYLTEEVETAPCIYCHGGILMNPEAPTQEDLNGRVNVIAILSVATSGLRETDEELGEVADAKEPYTDTEGLLSAVGRELHWSSDSGIESDVVILA